MLTTGLIAVLPKNYRRIALYAIQVAKDPVVLMNGKRVTDFSESGPVTQKGIRPCIDFEVRDGSIPILGFHDHPNEMWVVSPYRSLAEHCAAQRWLKIQLPRPRPDRARRLGSRDRAVKIVGLVIVIAIVAGMVYLAVARSL